MNYKPVNLIECAHAGLFHQNVLETDLESESEEDDDDDAADKSKSTKSVIKMKSKK